MKAGDIKKFLERLIFSDNQGEVNPQDFNINDNFLLGAVSAFKKGEPPDHLKTLIDGFMSTEDLTVQRRLATLKMVRDVLVGLSQPNITKEDKARLRGLLTAYYI